MNPKQKLAALYAEAAELAKKGDALSDADVTRVDAIATEAEALEESIRKSDAAAAKLAKLKGATPLDQRGADQAAEEVDVRGLSFGERFVKSEAYRGFRKANVAPVEGRPVSFKAKNLGRMIVSKADPAAIGQDLVGSPLLTPVRLPGLTDITYRQPTTILDLITRGTTAAPFVQYRKLVAITNAAAVVPERGLKPLSTLTTDLGQSTAYTFADGFKVTNQELADDGIIASLLNSVLRKNLALLVEDKVLNGSGTNEPEGILNTTGVLQQDFDTDAITTLRKAITLLRTTSFADVEAIVINPEDDEAFDLAKDLQGRFYGNGPFSVGPTTLWGIPRVTSKKIPVGTAVVGDLSTVSLLDLDQLNVEAFNQNEDDARHNLTYLRAEQRSLLLFREPAKVAVVDISAA